MPGPGRRLPFALCCGIAVAVVGSLVGFAQVPSAGQEFQPDAGTATASGSSGQAAKPDLRGPRSPSAEALRATPSAPPYQGGEQSQRLAPPSAVGTRDPLLSTTEHSPLTTHPSPLADDAGLHDVQFIGSRGWAVGDRGVIWHTADNGRTWSLQESSVECPLRSLCFLTDRVGWIAGGGTTPYTRLGYGVVLFTQDGGQTWEVLGSGSGHGGDQNPGHFAKPGLLRGDLPQLQFVKFFGLDEGVVVGEGTPEHPSGMFRTRDGGQTWEAVQGFHEAAEGGRASWRAADFTAIDRGCVAGLRGSVSLVGDGTVLPPRVDDLGLRGLRGIRLQQDDRGWLVGDGGLVLRTVSGGLVWEAPPKGLPLELREVADFRTVECRGERVWIAGAPGSVVWHSPDGGQTWTKQATGQTVPIHRIRFSSDVHGWAVGAMGMVLATGDGGQTWHVVRGGDRRAALLALHTRSERISFPLLVEQSGEYGYRSVVLLPARRDLGPDGHEAFDTDLRLHEAVVAAGGSAGEIGWQFPVDLPGLDADADRLIEEWNRRTEGELAESLLGRLVIQIRTWRPSVLILDQPTEGDATATLLNDALLRAVEQAADPTYFVQHRTLAGLPPWQVARVYHRLPAGSAGTVHVDPHAYLPRLGLTAQNAAGASLARLVDLPQQTAEREGYRPVHAQEGRGQEAAGSTLDSRPSTLDSALSGTFFGGLAIGFDARRDLPLIDDSESAAARELAERQRNFQAISARYLNDPRQSAQVIAQLGGVIEGMSDEQGALQLAQLADEYRRRSQWDLVEATLVELVERYPDQPVTHDAMCWLFHLWTGLEPAYQRSRQTHVEQQDLQSDPAAMLARIEQALQAAAVDPRYRQQPPDLGPDPVRLLEREGTLTADYVEWRSASVRNWQDQALRLASLMRVAAPGVYRTPGIQFPLAALVRQRGSLRGAEQFLQRYRPDTPPQTAEEVFEDNPFAEPETVEPVSVAADPWSLAASAELWLGEGLGRAPKPAAGCKFADQPPVLDGVLSDDCWQQAEAILLRPSDEAEIDRAAGPLVMLARDVNYLYLAASIPRADGVPADPPQTAGRKHDADLSRFDRLSFYLDIDRDYGTWYALHVDQRGWTAESCFDDAAWNPKWYVAADGDAARWRIEAAIPLREMVPILPVKGDVWAVGIVRTIPAVGIESWTHPAGSEPRPEAFGLLRFD